MEIDQITGSIVDAAMKVHTALGPGLLERVYEECLKHELEKRGLRVQSQVWVPVVYDGVEMEGAYKIDLLVEQVVVELKVAEQILEVHKAQLLSYLKLADKRVGLLINFNVVHLRNGIRRLVNYHQSSASPASFCGRGLITAPFATGRSAFAAGFHLTPTTSVAKWLASAFRPSS